MSDLIKIWHADAERVHKVHNCKKNSNLKMLDLDNRKIAIFHDSAEWVSQMHRPSAILDF